MRRPPDERGRVLLLLLSAVFLIGLGFFSAGIVSSHSTAPEREISGDVAVSFDLLAGGTETTTPTPSCTPGWFAGPDWNPPVGGVRAVGVYFPANGRFYALGGRSSDVVGSNFTHPFEYDPATNAWTTKNATFADTNVNNMACGVLTDGGPPQIYCVGGSAGGGTTATARVFSYDPVTDTITALTSADDWPGNPPSSGNILPGGFAVLNNKLYTIGAFIFTSATMLGDVWEFDPSQAVGSRWTLKAPIPVGHGYVPATAVGGMIYTAGGSVIDGTVLVDSADSYRYDPVADSWTTIANIPRPTGETRAITINGEMVVLGGGRTAPNPSNEIDIYDPVTNTWRIGPPFVTGRRNFPADTDGTRVWIAGGYDAGNFILTSMEIAGSCATPLPTPTFTATSTGTPSPTPTHTATFTPTPTQTPPCPPFYGENFDGVVAPALPAGWSAASFPPTESLWVTTTTGPDSPPNSAFVEDTEPVSDKILDSVGIAIGGGSAVLSFRNNFDTEFSGGVYWDGGVLEISSPNINGGAFTDILDSAVGGSFVTGGYTGIIDSTASNPLSGRMAWSGNSGGYINTIINLGPNVNGQTIVLRFRLGTDEAVGAPGWHVDSLTVGMCGTPLPTATSTATSTPTPTHTATNTPTPTNTPTASPTPTATGDPTVTPSSPGSQTPTPTPTPTSASTPTATASSTPGRSPTATETPSVTPSDTVSPTPAHTPTPTVTNTPTSTPTSTATSTPSPTPPLRSRADFDGDGLTDLSVYRPSEGNWYSQRSAAGFNATHFGESTDIPAPSDFDGDGLTDISVYRPSTGYWYRLNSRDNSFSFVNWGLNGDIPQAGDYDGDGHSDQAVFRPSSGSWYWLRSSDNQQNGMQFGQNGDRPVVGDYDGDGRSDLSVFRGGIWYRVNSSTGSFYGESFGIDTDMAVPADYDGDNEDDIAVFRPPDGNWYFHFSGNGQYGGIHWGQNGDVPVPGDYDGNNLYDIAVYRGGIWYIRAPGGSYAVQFGLDSDIPILKKYIP